MRVIFCAVLALAAVRAPAAVPAIPPGMQVELMVLNEVSTRNASPGTPVKLRLNKPVIVDGQTVLPVGTPAFGVVEASKDSSIALQRGTLGVRITHLELDGERIPLDSSVSVKSKGGSADDAIKVIMVPLYALFAPANSAKLRAGELLTATIAAPPANSLGK
jgi:hypothetical protein